MAIEEETYSRPSSTEKGDDEKVEEIHGDLVTTGAPDVPLQMTWKTWAVIFVLSSTFGLSFWPVPTTAALQTKLAAEWVSPLSSSWFVPAYTTASAIGFLLAGANSDLFGRRLFLLFGNVTCCVGFLVTATSKGPAQFTAGLAITGFGGGFCQMAMCSIPELMPNKFRHIGVCLSDGFVFVIVVIGPIVGRVRSISSASKLEMGGFVAQFMSLTALFLFYKPPKHPKGIPWHEALPGLDYVGAFLVVPGICLTLVGIINTTYKKSTDILVIAPMCVGFGVLVLFGLWETFSK